MRIFKNGQRMRRRLFSAGYIPIFGGTGYEFFKGIGKARGQAATIYYAQTYDIAEINTVLEVKFFRELSNA